ncbi:MAG: hypothetical protein AAB393_18390, partial [Bacteroidota bacterium]
SPYSLKELYWQKFTFAFLLLFTLAEFLSVLSIGMLRSDLVLIELAAVSTGFITLTLTSLNLGAGTYFAAFKEKNPIRVASSQGASVTFLVSMLYLTVVVVILIVPLYNYFQDTMLLTTPTASWIVAPIIGIGVISVFCFLISTGVGLKSIHRDY